MSASYAGISETVIHFVIYENIKRKLIESKANANMDDEDESVKDASDFVGMMLAAATSKTCATSIAYPHGEFFVIFLSMLIFVSVFFVGYFVMHVLELHDESLKDRVLDSNTHAVLFINDNDSSVSIKPLTKSYQNIQICVCAAAYTGEQLCLAVILSQKYWNKSL